MIVVILNKSREKVASGKFYVTGDTWQVTTSDRCLVAVGKLQCQEVFCSWQVSKAGVRLQEVSGKWPLSGDRWWQGSGGSW